jgi:4-hydroxy-tetrahydrodipicolinate synthase
MSPTSEAEREAREESRTHGPLPGPRCLRQERLDEPAFRAHLRRLAAAGVGVFVGGAGSGEAYTLSPDEMQRVLAIAVDELKGKVPVRGMGVEPRTAAEMIRFAELCAAAGVDAMQVYSLDIGHLGKPSNDEIERYLDDVLSVIAVHAVISTHFSVGSFVPVELLARISRSSAGRSTNASRSTRGS